jgi:hypothetical protein
MATDSSKITLVSNDGAEVVVGKAPFLHRMQKRYLTLSNRTQCRRALYAHQEHDGGSRRGRHDPICSHSQRKHFNLTFAPP